MAETKSESRVTESWDTGRALELIARILDECPRRRPASLSELEAQRILQEALESLGLKSELRPFRFNENLYANLAVHFGIGSLGSLLTRRAPAVSSMLHALAGLSYLLDSTKRGYLLRRLQPTRASQNLVATLPAASVPPSLRVVLMGHADAALTGTMFHPEVVRRVTPQTLPPSLHFLGRSLAVVTWTQLAAGGVGLVKALTGSRSRGLDALAAALSLPGWLGFLANLEVVVRDEVVPGANDNLSGAALLVPLAARLSRDRRADVELVFVVTGCEEAGLGGAEALAREMLELWDPCRTVVIGLDGMTNGALRYFEEGEIFSQPTSGWLRDVVARVAASEARFESVRGFRIPSGGTDALPFLVRGFDAVTLGCVDPELGAPRHYHLPDDTFENLDQEQLGLSLDFVEKLVLAIIDARVR